MLTGRRVMAVLLMAVIVAVFGAEGYLAQDERGPEECSPQALAEAQAALLDQFPLAGDDPQQAQANLFDLSVALQSLALDCGYFPSAQQAEAQIGRTLEFAGLPQIIAAMAVGDDLEVILMELDAVTGDSFNGQLLYNGLEPALDGIPLTCSACHMEESIAPLTEGVWTRVVEERLTDEALAGYTARQYLVESILHPNDYIAPGYNANIMPAAYGQRLDLQQLADLIAYLESQDQ